MAARLLCISLLILFGAAVAGVVVASQGEPEPPPARVAPRAEAPSALPAPPAPPARRPPAIRRRDSRAIGAPSAGSLVRGVRLPPFGRHFETWDPILRRSPNRPWRRNGTDDLVRMVVGVAQRYAASEPRALPMLVGDLSRPRGGDFGRRYGIIGHSTHQNGLDADVYYPRRDGRPIVPKVAADVERRLAQRLVDLFVAAGAQTILVGPNLDLRGPPGVVKPYPNHDNHLHVRIANPGG